MIGQYLTQIDLNTRLIGQLDERIEEAMVPFRDARDALTTIPGVSTMVADVIIAETGGDMTVFPTAGHLASWAGVAPGSNESAGRIKSAKTRPGNSYLKGALGTAAMAAIRSKTSHLAPRYRRIAARRGNMKALVATERAILTGVFHMLTTGTAWQDLGPDYYSHRDPERAKNQALRRLRTLGYDVELTPLAA